MCNLCFILLAVVALLLVWGVIRVAGEADRRRKQRDKK